MALQDWGALGEVIGALANIISLVYVGNQIKHGAQASRAATKQSFPTLSPFLFPRQIPGNAQLSGVRKNCRQAQ